jgi:Zn-dependent protease
MDILIFSFNIIILIFSVVIHEVAHAYTAYLFGDTTAKDQGRITLNPIPHIDLWWTILLPIIMYITSGGRIIFGGAKPVPINPMRFSNRKLGVSLVSASGAMSNLTLAFGSALLINLLLIVGINIFLINLFFGLVILINIILAFFNLLPIPPLDGSKILVYFMPEEYEYNLYKIGQMGILILIFLIMFGFIEIYFKFIIWPVFAFVTPIESILAIKQAVG